MPIKECSIDGKNGWKWGDQGKCYTGVDAKDKAHKQGIAIGEYLHEYREMYKLASLKIGFDFDGTLSTKKGQQLYMNTLGDKYIITARHPNDSLEVFKVTDSLIIPRSKVIFTSSNANKIKKVKELRINKFFDNNEDVINQLIGVGVLFTD